MISLWILCLILFYFNFFISQGPKVADYLLIFSFFNLLLCCCINIFSFHFDLTFCPKFYCFIIVLICCLFCVSIDYRCKLAVSHLWHVCKNCLIFFYFTLDYMRDAKVYEINISDVICLVLKGFKWIVALLADNWDECHIIKTEPG